ncbi:ABC1-domain-containing protein [Auricularia subglabra TFB-10046 SS5]|nr:ABC1-domain-containing protein [Auricularia subglabra TFB-10046 SS5]
MQAAILPTSYREVFAGIFDRAPTVPLSEVRQTFLREFGRPPEELFDSFDPVPVASASIAQVHRAVLNGQEVAVKVQKAAIAQQIKWDLACYYILLKLQEWWFEMPITFMHSFVSQQIIQETDFMREARNATRAAEDIQKDSWLRQRVYVPKVYWERTSKRIMTAEWIDDSSRLNDVDAIVKRGFDTKYIMDTVISIISAQTFVFGFVHCDPHPGNVLIRPHPSDPRRPQVVLIDHGLYVELPEKFRKEYTTLWRSVFVGDIGAVERTVKLWGLAPGSRDMVASSILLRPHRMKKRENRDLSLEERELTPEQQKEKAYQMQQEMMNRMKSFLQNEELIPKELMFIGRCQSMLQGNNQALGSPSNRVNLIAKWSAIGYRDVVPPVSSIFTLGPRPLLRTVFELIFFRVSLSLVDIAFRLTRFWQWCRGTSRVKGRGFEDLLEKQLRDMAKSEYGVEIDEAVFSG